MPKTDTKNQTEKEYFDIVTTGRRGVEDMFAVLGSELRGIAAPTVAGGFDVWTQRALVEITSNDDLRPVIATKAGLFSVYRALAKCAQMDLQVGGQFPHAYLAPMGGKAVLVVSDTGYSFASAHGRGAVLQRDPLLVEVYEKDSFRVDQAAATVEHETTPFVDRGKIVGYYMVLEYMDGHREIATITHAEVCDVIEKYGNLNSPAYKKSRHAMERKTAAKQLLKRPMKMSEGLAMLYSLDEEIPVPEAPEQPMRNVTERTSDRLSRATEALEPENAGGTEETEAVGEKPAETAKAEPEGPDLF